MDLNKIISLMMLCVPMFVGAQTLTFTDHEPMVSLTILSVNHGRA